MIDVSVVIPARNEEDNIFETVTDVHHQLTAANINHEVIVVDDHSADHTGITAQHAQAHVIRNTGPAGYGNAVRLGLQQVKGRYVTIMVADGSDHAVDLVRMCQAQQQTKNDNVAVFGHRFIAGAKVTDYPKVKRIANRLGNRLTARLLHVDYNDVSNPFKLYPTYAVRNLLPSLMATDFSLGFELCARYIKSGGKWVVIPINWRDRVKGSSKFKVKHAVGFLRTLYRVV